MDSVPQEPVSIKARRSKKRRLWPSARRLKRQSIKKANKLLIKAEKRQARLSGDGQPGCSSATQSTDVLIEKRKLMSRSSEVGESSEICKRMQLNSEAGNNEESLDVTEKIKLEKTESENLQHSNAEVPALDMSVEIEPVAPAPGSSGENSGQEPQAMNTSEPSTSQNKPKPLKRVKSENKEQPQRMSQRISLTPTPKYREMPKSKRPKQDRAEVASESPASAAPEPLGGPVGPRVAVRSLRELSSRLNSFMSRTEDDYDAFGRYIAGLLRRLPQDKAQALQPKIVDMITSAALEEDPPEEEPVIEEPAEVIPEAQPPEVADPLARSELEDVKPNVETVVFHVQY